MDKNLFEIATKNKYRFETSRGHLTVEDLWDLPVEELDETYRGYAGALRSASEDTLLTKPDRHNEELANKRDIVVLVVRSKQADAQARLEQHQRREKAARIRGLLAQKQDEALAGKSEQELQDLLSQLD